ncbi:TOBE domain-containing protein, partial [Nocardioides sp.]|uniref:TOBE domain-containing protein n=1 Tax=Nocardioides sp. TaxID=35761 RepID=UPI00286D786F
AEVLGASVPVIGTSITSGTGTAMVRPESVSVTAAAAGTASVVSVGFLGPISRVHIMTDAGDALMAQLPSSLAVGLAPQDRVDVSIAPTPVLVVSS